VRILLDENLPEGLFEPLRRLGHVVDSVGSLGLKGLANGPPYREVASGYDLFFTKDREFAARVEALRHRAGMADARVGDDHVECDSSPVVSGRSWAIALG